jgi:NAD(P)-dependent dehydrogenase (short-subunit alcohol dehydrogenase family)
MTLAGRGALVTGGGRGIGAAIAGALAHRGARVVVAARHLAEVEALAEALRPAHGEVFAARVDVADPASVTELARTAARLVGGIDILVNNAGSASSAPIQRITLEGWHQVLAVNATGTLLCTQAFLPAMLTRGWGRIVNVASVAGLQGGRYIAAYSASKHAVMGFTRSAAAEVAGTGVTVNAVCPGYVDTPMTGQTLARISQRTGRTRVEALESLLSHAGQPRLVSSAEVAETVVGLCQESASALNGQAILLDAGAFSA